jgi:hypothetical protein
MLALVNSFLIPRNVCCSKCYPCGRHWLHSGSSFTMSMVPEPRIVSADRMDDSVIVTFDDGRCAIYSASLLYTVLPQAKEVDLTDGAEDEPE